MFLKVFKYDFKAIFFKFIPVLALLPVLAIIVRLVNLMRLDNVFAGLMISLVNGLFWVGCFGLLIYTVVICIMRYVKSLFRDQGYLTHTLPVNKHQLLLSQILADVLMELISVVLVGLCVLIAYFDMKFAKVIVDAVSQMFNEVFTVEEFWKLFSGTIVLLIFISIFGTLQSLFIIYTGVAIGHAFSKNKGILSIVFCIAINYGLSMITGIINLIIGTVVDFATITTDQVVGVINLYLGISLAESIIICVGAYFLDIYLLKNRLNLE